MKQVASLQYGVIFKKAFCDPEIFTAFVRDIIGIEIEIDHVETEKQFAPPIGQVQSRFDLFAEDVKNRLVVDIQHERYGDHYDRFLHYHCTAILEQVPNAQYYRPPKKVYTIVVLTSGDKHKRDVCTIDFDPKDLQGNGLGEIHHKVIYLCPKYVSQQTPKPYRTWLLAIQDTLDGEVEESAHPMPEIQKVFNYIKKDDISPEERAKMFDEHAQALLQEDKKAEGKLEIAQAMLAEGEPLEKIAKYTGLSNVELEQLAV